jgi:hypothetical protein
LQSVCPDNSLQASLCTKAYISCIKQLIKILEITCSLGTVLLTKAFHGFPSPHRTDARIVPQNGHSCLNSSLVNQFEISYLLLHNHKI